MQVVTPTLKAGRAGERGLLWGTVFRGHLVRKLSA